MCIASKCDFDWQLAAYKRAFPLCYSETRATFANYFLLRYKSIVSCC